MKKVAILPLTLSLSNRCDRGCLHCWARSNMKGGLFSLEKAKMLVGELTACQRLGAKQGFDIVPKIEFTGSGELLLNPDTLKILDIVFRNETVEGSLNTSGVNPFSDFETGLLDKLLSRKYISRLDFFVSFNLFEKRFPERLKKSLELLKKVKEQVTIRICHSEENERGSRKKLFSLLNGMGVDISRENLLLEKMKIQLEFFSLIRRGGAENLPVKNLYHLAKCFFLADERGKVLIHLGTDGNWYPGCECPEVEHLKLGSLSDGYPKAIHASKKFKKELLEKTIENSLFCKEDFCLLCKETARKILKKQ